MATIGWRFPPLSGGTRQGYTNNDIEAFKGEQLIDNLAREICQNSLDAKAEKNDSPVKVVFELKRVPSQDYTVFSGYKKCLQGCRDYWGNEMDANLSRFLSDAEEMLLRQSIPILVAGDYGTCGLCGSKSREISSPWEALTGADGMSVKSAETSGGSFGIGKNAPFACSSLSMVFYNTFASDGGKAFIGVARLATLYDDNKKETQRVGKYQNNDNDNEVWTPILSGDSDPFRDLFTRSEEGTDVIIVGFNQESEWMKNVSKAVLGNFFVAVSEGKLIVELKDQQQSQVIDSSTISQIILDFSDDHKMSITSQLYKAFTAPDKKEYLSILSDNDAELFIKSDSSFNRSIASFRNTGMLIGVKSRRIFQHYAAVLIIRGSELGELLRATEPPRHNRWDYKLITGASEKDKKHKAKNAIEIIDDSLLSLIKKQFEIVTEDSIDAVGVGEYIPDSLDGMGGVSEGDDILKPKIKIGKIKTVATSPGTISVAGVKAIGTEKEGTIHNASKNPTPPPTPPHPPSPVSPDDKNVAEGVAQGKGTKTVIVPNFSAQRAFPINSAIGLYKIVIIPKETYKNLFVSCSALGEDGRSDLLDMKSFTCNGKPIQIKGGQAGPLSVIQDTLATFFVKFDTKEKMVLSLHMTEVTKR